MIAKALVLGLLCAVVGYMLGEMGFRGKRIFTALGIVVMIGCAGEGIDALTSLSDTLPESGVWRQTVTAALKVVGIGYVFGIASDLCSELGESGVSGVLTLVGRIEIILLILPYLRQVISLGTEMIL